MARHGHRDPAENRGATSWGHFWPIGHGDSCIRRFFSASSIPGSSQCLLRLDMSASRVHSGRRKAWKRKVSFLLNFNKRWNANGDPLFLGWPPECAKFRHRLVLAVWWSIASFPADIPSTQSWPDKRERGTDEVDPFNHRIRIVYDQKQISDWKDSPFFYLWFGSWVQRSLQGVFFVPYVYCCCLTNFVPTLLILGHGSEEIMQWRSWLQDDKEDNVWDGRWTGMKRE